jgi:hypothetical protein
MPRRSRPTLPRNATTPDGKPLINDGRMYNYTRFRSGLEIRFVKELDARGFRWFYEPERLGEGRYLVDFYLPQCKTWVEVKGQVDSRDHLCLREVADLVKRERKQRLYMWMDEKAFLVTLDGFKAMTHADFWAALESLRQPPVDSPTEAPTVTPAVPDPAPEQE